MTRLALLLLALIELIWFAQGGGTGNLISALFNVGAAVCVDLANSWRVAR